MLEQRIQQQFFDSADLLNRVADTMARPVAEAASALGVAITSGAKVPGVRRRPCRAAGAALRTPVTGRFERERPPLAALAIGMHPGVQPAQEVRPWACPATCCCSSTMPTPTAPAVISAAQGKDMTIIVLAGRSASAFGELLAETDVLVAVPHERAARVVELQLLVLHCLCDAVDFQLMGDSET